MKAIQLYDKFDEEIVGTVLLKENVDFATITNRWDEYQKENNGNYKDIENMPDIFEFAELNSDICEAINIDFYQPSKK